MTSIAAAGGGHLSPVLELAIALIGLMAAVRALRYMVFGRRMRDRQGELAPDRRRGVGLFRLVAWLYGLHLLRAVRRDQRRAGRL